MAPPSSTLAWKIPWTEEPGRPQSVGLWRVGQDWVTSLSRIGEGNGNPLQCSCLENPRDRGAWWTAVYGVAQSRTRLKQLSSSSSRVQWPEKAMATHSSVLAWRIPGTAETGGLPSMGLHRVGHDWSDLAAAAAAAAISVTFVICWIMSLKIYWIPNFWYHRMWLYLEMGYLQR